MSPVLLSTGAPLEGGWQGKELTPICATQGPPGPILSRKKAQPKSFGWSLPSAGVKYGEAFGHVYVCESCLGFGASTAG